MIKWARLLWQLLGLLLFDPFLACEKCEGTERVPLRPCERCGLRLCDLCHSGGQECDVAEIVRGWAPASKETPTA